MATREILKKEAELLVLRSKRNNLQIRGASMYPALQENWKAEVVPIKEENIKIGDIIVFDMGRELAVHRVVGKINRNSKTCFLQKGDNESMPRLIKTSQVIGKVYRVFNSSNQEIPPKFWMCPSRKEITVLKLLNLIYSILYRLKKIVFGSKRNSLVKFFGILYWKLFFSALKSNRKGL